MTVAKRADGRIQCWPEGHATRSPCHNEIPDTDNATMNRFGWGFVWARDDGSDSGVGPFYACPEHRDDIDEEQREVARQRYSVAAAIASLTPEQTKVLMGEAVREGDVMVLRVRSPATRVGLARRGILVDRMYSETLTELGEAVRQQLLARGDR